MITCLAGNPSVDRWMEIGTLSTGVIHRPDAVLVVPGGKGLHVARVSAALGAPAVATGILAGHAGRWIADALQAEGVRGRFAWGPGETRSCLSVSDRATGELTEFYEPGTPAGDAEWSELVAIVDDLLAAGGWLAMSGSLSAGLPIDGYGELIERARAAGVRSALDTRGPWLESALKAGPDLVKINAEEAAELVGEPVAGHAQALAVAAVIRGRAGGDGHAVAITLGEAGVVLLDPGGRAWSGRTPAVGRFPVGSGDAFLAGTLVALALALAGDAAWPDAAALGLGAGAANAELPGAGRLDAARARALAAAAAVASSA